MPVASELKKPVTTQAEELDLSKFIILDGRVNSYPDIYLAKKRTNFGSDWYNTHESIPKIDTTLYMESPIMLIDLISDLKSGKRLYDGNGDKISSRESEQILDEILGIRNPLRGEWLNASFELVKGHRLYIKSNHRFIDGKLIPGLNEPLEDCLMEDCYVDLLSANRQGLPTRKADNLVYYRHPRNGCVARFDAGSGGVDLNCDRDPQFSYPALGVRAAKK